MPNQLAYATSPYLLQHADNPVDWLPWGDAAFEQAAREGKPILLSIGYATCHWCHVMAHESFEDEEIAAFLNAHFVSIKVDREERPDVDRIYMSYVQAITGHGGWPLNVWLTPDRKPFFGGTYFPPRDAHGRRGFLSLLAAIATAWQTQREPLIHEANRVLATLAHHTRNAAAPESEGAAGGELLETASRAFEDCFVHLHEAYDEERGGFGGAPKFPRAANLHFLVRAACIQGMDTDSARRAVAMVSGTLSAMARGGIHDHVGGGFHRYSVDAGWFVPHFEKMLYDQAQIALNYLEAHQATGLELHAHVVRDILGYVERDLLLPGGAYASAEDADSETPDGSGHGGRAEGAFYVWRKTEIDALLGDNAPLVCAHFGVSEAGNVPPELDPHQELQGSNVLHQQRPLAETAALFNVSPTEASDRLVSALERLREVRSRRERPLRDDKVVAAWNGLMISALARASVVLDEPDFAARAERTASFLERELFDASRGVLHRSHRLTRGTADGFAEDYACVIQGLLDLYEATGSGRWLLWALRLQETLDAQFWDSERGGYFASRANDPHLVLRLKDDYDGAEPAANSIAAMNLYRFAQFFPGETIWAEKGRAALRALEPQWTQHPQALPQMLCAIEYALSSPRQAVLVGASAGPSLRALRRELFRTVQPRRCVWTVTAEGLEPALARRAEFLAGYRPLADGKCQAYLCENETCLPPVDSAEALAAQLSGARA
ncbi:thioredoxin domain-containing protein [Nibricoccus sp. IMCC34717]|uniref:thioredoxin domain-containing protein n=1 Tax=Nibricoccus sp. IMCC34717 TaxID=3034021 RepID=UPI00384A6FF7